MSLNIHEILQNYEAVLFDMDGTLIDSMWVWNSVDIDFLKRYNEPVPETLKADIEGMSYYQTAEYFKNRFRLSESLDEIINIWDYMALEKYKNEVPVKEGVLRFIETLSDRDIPMAICTSNSRFLTLAVLEKYPVLKKINLIVTSDEVTEGKPAPTIYLTAAKGLKVNPCKCLVFEDLPNGIMAGKNAGMKTCTIDDDFSKAQIGKKIELADYYIHDYNDLF